MPKKILYIEDQEDMVIGLTSLLEDTEFETHFTSYTDFEQLKTEVLEFCPDAVISDDDIGGKSYADNVFAAVQAAAKEKNKEIITVACSALANAEGLEQGYKKIGFLRFFNNDGTEEEFKVILDFIRRKLK